MTTRSLLRILLVLGVGWLTFLSPSLFTLRSILRDADGYSQAEYLVAGGHCDEGDERVSCFLEGKVLLDRGQTSSDEELFVGFSLTRPAGTRLAVFYNPTRVSERLLEANGAADAAQLARRRLWEAGRLLLLVLGSATFVHVLLRTGPRRVVRGPRQLAIDLGGVAPASGLGAALSAIGTVLFSHGLNFLAWKISPPEIGGVVLGLLLAAAGTPLLVRRFLVLAEDEGKAIRGWHFLGLRFREREESLPLLDRVGLRRATDDFVVFVAGPDASERVEASSSLISARDRARRLASLLGVPLDDATAGSSAPPGDADAERFPEIAADVDAAASRRARRLPPAPDERVHRGSLRRPGQGQGRGGGTASHRTAAAPRRVAPQVDSDRRLGRRARRFGLARGPDLRAAASRSGPVSTSASGSRNRRVARWRRPVPRRPHLGWNAPCRGERHLSRANRRRVKAAVRTRPAAGRTPGPPRHSPPRAHANAMAYGSTSRAPTW
jgi:hypothetical protein